MRRRHPYTWGRDHPLVVDGILAMVLGALGVLSEVATPQEPGYRSADALSFVLTVGATLPLSLRRRHPLAVYLVIFASSSVHFVQEYSGAGPVFGLLVSLYGVAAYVSRRTAAFCLIPLLLFVGSGLLATEELSADDRWALLGINALFVTAWVLGDNMRVRRAYVAAVEDRAIQLEREQDAQARRAVLEERARIARELHDVVAHSMSVMVVQAGAARRTLDRDRDRAVEAIGQIESTGRGALAEMRRLLGVLRNDADRNGDPASAPGLPGDAARPPTGQSGPPQGDLGSGDDAGEGAAVASGGRHGGAEDPARPGGDADGGPSLLPQPGIDQLPTLVGQCRDAGLDVTLRVEGTARSLPSSIELVVYRIVQEALTNTMRHAGPAARAEVELRYGPDAVRLTAVDDGRGAAADTSARRPIGEDPATRMALVQAPGHEAIRVALVGQPGHGLTGMQERVALYGGRFTASPRAGGGFEVCAEIPLLDGEGP